MIAVQRDPDFWNRVANDPAVRPWLEGEGRLDLTARLAEPGTVALADAHGGFVALQHEPCVYEFHTLFLPSGRGRAVREAASEALRFMFTRTDCRELLTRCADDHRAARFAVGAQGFQPWFHRDEGWRRSDGRACPATYYRLDLARWLMLDPALAAHGRAFHGALEAAKRAAGSSLVAHAEDEAHDRAAGAAALMIQAGQPHKAVAVYNNWARLAGYAPISITPEWRVDVGDAVFRADTMEIVECR